MRWGYKTVLFELKKEGFLGSAFLDETEVEESLNEYGKSGWELVSMMETQDGLIAVFKQPLDAGMPPVVATAAATVVADDEEDVFLFDESDDAVITEDDIIEEPVSIEPEPEPVPDEEDFDKIRIE